MKGSNQYILMIVHLEGTSVLYSTLHCLIKFKTDQIKLRIIVLHCLRMLCNDDLDFYDSSLTPFLGHLQFSFFKIEVLPGAWE